MRPAGGIPGGGGAEASGFDGAVLQAQERGDDPAAVRIAKSYVEGAGVNLEFARTMGNIRELRLPVTVFQLGDLHFATVPGEIFSTIRPENAAVISYANGYCRYLCGEKAYEKNYCEAMAALWAGAAENG